MLARAVNRRTLVLKDAARTLRIAGQQGGRVYYEGEGAESIVGYARQAGGPLTLEYLSNYQPE